MSMVMSLVGALAPLALSSAPVTRPAPLPPVEAFARLPNAQAAELSPSGRRIAFVSRTAAGRKLIVAEDDKPIYANAIFDVARGDNKPIREGKIRKIEWVDEDHLLIFVEKIDQTPSYFYEKYKINQTLSINLKLGSAFWVFSKQAFVLHNSSRYHGFSTIGGHVYGYFDAQDVTPEDSPIGPLNLFRVNLDDGQAEKLERGVGREFRRDWQVGTDGRVLAYADYNVLHKDLDLHSAGSGASLAQFKDVFGNAALLGLGRAADTLVFAIPAEVGVWDYYEVGLAKGARPARLLAGQDDAFPLFDFQTQAMSGVATSGDYPDQTYFDPIRQARWTAAKKAFPDRHVRLVSSSAKFDRLIVQTEGDGDAGAYWLIDSVAGAADLYANIHPDIPPEAVGKRRMVSWKARDGLEIHGVLTLPPDREARNLPVVVMPHEVLTDHDDLGFDPLAAALAARGYAVLQPNFRGSSGYGEAFIRAGYGELGRKMQTDIADGLTDLAAKGVVDPKRACAVGAGLGGLAALTGTIFQHGLYKCVVAVAGVSDLNEMQVYVSGWRSERAITTPFWRIILAPKPMDSGELRAISPAAFASNADAPILLLHGSDDTVVPFEQSQIMERALKRAGKPVELVRLDGEDHQISHEPTRVQLFQTVAAFVEKYAPPH